jgi:outer membrane protein TolC
MSMVESAPPVPAVEAAIARVLGAERDARESVAKAVREAEALNERARAVARSLAERTEQRIRAVRAAYEAHVSAEVAAIDAQAAEQDAGQPLTEIDLERLQRALVALAAELTDGSA